MAHQIRHGIEITIDPMVLLQRPELATLLGTVVAEAAHLERELAVLYSTMMGGSYLPRPHDPNFFAMHPVALQVFDTLDSFRLRRDLLERLTKWCAKELLTELKENVIPAIDDANRLRNVLVHSTWGIAQEYPDAVILCPFFGKYMAYEKSDFNKAIDGIIVARNTVGKFIGKVEKSLKGKETLFELPTS